MKGTVREIKEKQNINYKAKFAGETLVTPIMFNPTGSQIKDIKGLSIDVADPTYKETKRDYKEDGTYEEVEYSVVSLLCQFEPNKILETNTYPEKMFVNYKILVSPELVIGKDKTDENNNVIPNSAKSQLIDDHNQVAWVRIKPKQKIADAIAEAIADSTTSPYDSVHKIDPNTARVAMVGEVALYHLLFNMSRFNEHRVGNEDKSKDTPLNDFVISSKPSESFKKICAGDFTELNKFTNRYPNSPVEDFFFPNGVQNQVGMLLVVEPSSDKTQLRQSCFRAVTERNQFVEHLFRPFSRRNKLEGSVKETLGVEYTRLPKDFIKSLTNVKYPFKGGAFGGTLEFKEMTLDSVNNKTTIKEEEDDLPF